MVDGGINCTGSLFDQPQIDLDKCSSHKRVFDDAGDLLRIRISADGQWMVRVCLQVTLKRNRIEALVWLLWSRILKSTRREIPRLINTLRHDAAPCHRIRRRSVWNMTYLVSISVFTGGGGGRNNYRGRKRRRMWK